MGVLDQNAANNAATVNAVNTAANGTPAAPDWNAYLAANPDVQAQYDKVNGPGLKFYLGLGGGPHDPGMTAQEFAQWHYNSTGQAEGRPTSTTPATDGIAGTAQTTATNAVGDAQTAANNAYNAVGDAAAKFLTGTQDAVAKLIGQNTVDNKNTIDIVTKLVDGVNSNNASLVDTITQAQANVGSQLTAAVAAFNKSQTQTAHDPDLALILAANRKKMSAASATQSTGPTGVPASSMTLGGNTVMGT